MNAIIPINVTAIRVSPTDNSNVVSSFKGRVANFNNMPYGKKEPPRTSTGDAIVQLLESHNSPKAPLDTGIHLHWELPDYFRKGLQSVGENEIVFPQVPNRWLIVRYLSIYNNQTKTWGPLSNYSWVVESDYISLSQLKDSDGKDRPSVPVPLPVNPSFGSENQPFRFMGRVVDAKDWPKIATNDQYLWDYKDEDDKDYYLTSTGFLGPGFSSYYPDCCSVFGFTDRFLDNKIVCDSLTKNTPIQFKASYQVIGWIDNGADPLDGATAIITQQYKDYVAESKDKDISIVQTPADFFNNFSLQNFKWQFNKDDITYTLDADKNLTSLNLPKKTLCTGIFEEVVWDMLISPGSSGFLGDPETPTKPGIWKDEDLKVAVGNTSIDALSALLKFDNDNEDNDPDLLKNYEYLLDALQLGILKNLESEGNNIIALEEALHTSGFARKQGGLQWIIQKKPVDPKKRDLPINPNSELTLPLTLAEELNQLNQAQKNYDMGRDALSLIRRQIFMDWYRYIKMYAGNVESPFVSVNDLTNFLTQAGQNELDEAVAKGDDIGIIAYLVNSENSGAIIGVKKPVGSNTSKAYLLWNQLQKFLDEMKSHTNWQVIAVPSSSFWLPTDPTAVIEGSRLEPARRTSAAKHLTVRLTTELLDQLSVNYDGKDFAILASNVTEKSNINASLPYQKDFISLVGEACLLIPSLVTSVATALSKKGGTGNPAVINFDGFVDSLSTIVGGVSGLESKSPSTGGTPLTGLFKTIREENYVRVVNPTEEVTTPINICVTFTNQLSNGWVPQAEQWNTQMQYIDFSTKRYDPFMPVFIIWNLTLDPLKKNKDPLNYNSTNITDYFHLNEDAIDYGYMVNKLPYTTGDKTEYKNSAIMSKKATFSLVAQIDNYKTNYPDDIADETLEKIAADYYGRKILSQTMSGLNAEQLLTYHIAQIKVEDLTISEARDTVTKAIKNAALSANLDDNWYDSVFNSLAPIPAGSQAISNFGPLRSGFIAIQSLEVVDVFGQVMQMFTPEKNTDGSLKAIAAMSLAPMKDDIVNANKIYLPPRILTPTRLWYRWLSATHNDKVTGINNDFVEMNTHPATSPVFGWVLPNHLDNNLFFYNADGTPIGSFGVEHGNLKYRTRAGNINNPQSILSRDIGPENEKDPPVNIHLANFMWYINNKSGEGNNNGAFLKDLMIAILNSDKFINPTNFSQNASLAVLIGRPLALTRSVLSMETAGNLLPLNQADTQKDDSWSINIKAGTSKYADRQISGAANINNIKFPLRLGDLSNIDDGLIGYIIEQDNPSDPYEKNTFFAPAANPTHDNGVRVPSATNIQLTLNSKPIVLTFLMDPRAAVHATTGVLPVEELGIPEDQYSAALRNLQMTFFTMPVLQRLQGLEIPLPKQSGYVWRWINPGDQVQIPLETNAVNSNAIWNYTPQTLLEGWLNLSPDPDPAPPPEKKP